MKINSTIFLKDEKNIQLAMERGQSDPLSGRNLTITEILRINTSLDDFYFEVLYLSEDEILVKKTCGDVFQWRYFQTPDWFVGGSVNDQLDNDNHFLYQQPEDEEEFEPEDLEFSKKFEVDDEEFESIGSYYGNSEEYDLISLEEYSSDKQIALLFETKNEDSGGYVSFFLGYNINENEIEVFDE